MAAHPRDTFITVYGRKPVLEALRDRAIVIEKLVVDRRATGDVVAAIRRAAADRGVEIIQTDARGVTRISKNGRQDQGVAIDVRAPRMADLESWLAAGPQPGPILALDNITTPANIGMILRTAVAAGLSGIVLPRRGCPEVGPLVIKASAGVAFRAPILRCAELPPGLDALAAAGYRLVGLDARTDTDLYDADLEPHTVLVLGSESEGLSRETIARLHGRVAIDMAAGVESLNVAAAASVLAFELRRRGLVREQS